MEKNEKKLSDKDNQPLTLTKEQFEEQKKEKEQAKTDKK